jgi:uncharacterized membrane protein YdcZ (DUF606 family)
MYSSGIFFVPSSNAVSCAPHTTGQTWAFQRRKLSLVSFSVTAWLMVLNTAEEDEDDMFSVKKKWLWYHVKGGLSGAFDSARVTCLYRAETASTMAYTW